VLSIYAAGYEGQLYKEDLSLQKHQYTIATSRSHVVYMKTLTFEKLAKEYRGKISFVHYFPRVVITSAYSSPDLPTWFTIIWKIFGPIVKTMFATNSEESGDRVLYLASNFFSPLTDAERATGRDNRVAATSTDGLRGGGSFSVNWNNEVWPQSYMEKRYKLLRGENFDQTVWKHTMSVFDTIKAGNTYEG